MANILIKLTLSPKAKILNIIKSNPRPNLLPKLLQLTVLRSIHHKRNVFFFFKSCTQIALRMIYILDYVILLCFSRHFHLDHFFLFNGISFDNKKVMHLSHFCCKNCEKRMAIWRMKQWCGRFCNDKNRFVERKIRILLAEQWKQSQLQW